ncbi:MAG: Gfo/Idh/MocA family oxidoreductase [Planctomycetaceae bacterium]|nr:Gfo/Idh/MocA family oxidoreductase [Planctomycetaceae bacterium]
MVAPHGSSGGVTLDYLMIGGGPGAFIGGVHKMALDLLGKARLVGGCFSQSHEKSLQQAAQWGLDPARAYKTHDEMLQAEAERDDKPAFVVIVTPNHMHYPAAKAALEAGFHVSCDKPLCLTPAQADELVALSKKNGLEFLVTYTYTGYPLVRQAREMIRRGDLGDIRLVTAEYIQDWLADAPDPSNKQASWRTDPARSGLAGCMGDIGSHAENLVHFTTGLDMTRLSAKLDTFVPDRQLDDNGYVWCTMANGASGSIWASQVAIGCENGLSLRVYGTSGALEWHQENPNVLVFTPKGQPARILTRAQGYLHPHAARYTHLPTGHPEGLFEAFANLYDGFISTIVARRDGKEPGEYDVFPDVVDGARGIKFIHATLESSKKGSAWLDVKF